jgi:integrase/recombinase XerC
VATAFSSSLTDLADRLERGGAGGRPLAATTRRAYLKDARLLAKWLEDAGLSGPSEISSAALEAALREQGWSKATRSRALTAARHWLAPWFPPNRSPADLVDGPRVTPPPIPRLSQQDARRLLDAPREPRPGPVGAALDLRDQALIELVYGSGLRRQEACDLVLAGLDFDNESVRVVGKGDRARTVPLTEPAVAAISAWLAEGRPALVRGTPAADLPAAEAPVFVSRSGRRLDGSSLYRVVSAALRRIGRAGGPHLLRHATGTHLLEGPDGEGGAHLRVVQEVLGHSSIDTTQRYTGVTTRTMQDALRKGHPRG